MMTKEFGRQWTKRDTAKSALLFLMHFLIFILLGGVLILSDYLSDISAFLSQNGANYLYAIFCIFLLFIITYFYFFFENRAILERAKNIALVFTVLDLYLILSCLIGYNLAIYARPVALVALLIFVLVGRREAIFLNIIFSPS